MVSLAENQPQDPRPLGEIVHSTNYHLSEKEEAFLDQLQRDCYNYFVESADKTSGLIPDRAKTDGSWFSGVASSASTGFGLTAHCIAAERGWITKEEAYDKCLKVLKFTRDHFAHTNGFLHHFVNPTTGELEWDSEASSIDTALFLTGAFTASGYFENEELTAVVNDIYNRVDWKWMTNGNEFLDMGYRESEGFINVEWDHYSEMLVMLLLGIGSDSDMALDAEHWENWPRDPKLTFKGEGFCAYPPLFVHHYSQNFFDFRTNRDKHLDYFRNSQLSTLAQREYMDRLGKAFPDTLGHWNVDLWGLTASDSPDGYKDWGAPYVDPRLRPWRGDDGTLTPSAPGGSICMTPKEAIATLMLQKEKFADMGIYGQYGFTNAYNPRTGWVGPDVIAIDTGITLISAENLRSGFAWKHFMKHPAAQRAFERCNFYPIKPINNDK